MSETQSKPETLQEKILRRSASLRQGWMLAGLWSNLQGAKQTHRWAERDVAAKHQTLYGNAGNEELKEYDERTKAESEEGDGMRLGDENHNHPPAQVIPIAMQAATSSNPAAWILAAGLAAAAGFFGRDLIDDEQKPVPTQGTDETVQIRLGRIEDYLRDQE